MSPRNPDQARPSIPGMALVAQRIMLVHYSGATRCSGTFRVQTTS